MGMIGGDVAAMRGLAQEFTRRCALVEQSRQRLNVMLEGLPWVGPDRDSFISDWHSLHQPGLVDLAGDLADAARRVLRHAAAQEAASRAES